METEPEPHDGAQGTAADASLTDALRDLIDDGQTLVQAELAYQQSRAVYAWGRTKGIAALVVLGIAFGFFALLAMVVGFLLALATVIGTWWALAAVTGGLGLLAALCLGLAVQRFRRMRGVLLGKDGGQ
ncbi:MAG: phage holin family protein [Sphingomonadales bacterium]|nr:phage holin family protein [Sphingomonadales bacterium]MDE2569763.1 phage holin family protein [Sphingomonadales bacterium]